MKINNDLYEYIYDNLYNITDIYLNNKLINHYEYDNFNELIKEDNYNLNKTIRYTYDNAGNILKKQEYELDTYNLLHTDTYEYNNANWEDQLTKYNNESITYDEIGNPISIGNKTLTWNNGRQLSSYTDNDLNVTYAYNKDGIRDQKVVNNTITNYFTENNKIIFEQTGNNMIYYIRDEEGSLIGFKYNNTTYYYIKNIQEDIIGLTDSSYNLVCSYEYDSWGKLISIKDSNNNVITNTSHIGYINPFRYRSYYYDNETKLYYLNSRYYNPDWGRFVNADNLFEQNNLLLGNNLYIYCTNNPANYLDSTGRSIALIGIDELYKYSYAVVCTKDNGYYKVFIEIEGKNFVADINGNAIRFNFEVNSDYNHKYAYTLATAVYNAYTIVYGEKMYGRTVEGISMEIKLHDSLYKWTGASNFMIADMGTSKNDNNSIVSEILRFKNIAIKKVTSHNFATESKNENKKPKYTGLLGFLSKFILIL